MPAVRARPVIIRAQSRARADGGGLLANAEVRCTSQLALAAQLIYFLLEETDDPHPPVAFAWFHGFSLDPRSAA